MKNVSNKDETAKETTDAPSAPVTNPAASSLRRRIEYAAVALFCCVLFASSFFLYTRHNNFSPNFHPDEATKAVQVLTQTRNHKHPHLLLEGTEVTLRLFGLARTPRNVVLTGRCVAATYGALAVVALALAGYRYAGLFGLLVSGACVGLCPSLLLHGHYMKEDTALVLGIALTLLAAIIFCRVRSRRSQTSSLIFLGAATGVAVSGKFVGVAALAAVLILVVATPPRGWTTPSRWIAVLIAFAVTAAVINHRALEDPVAAWSALTHEAEHGVGEHRGLTMDQPNFFFAKGLIRETMPHVLVLAGFFLVSLALFSRRTGSWDLFLPLFAALFLFVISFGVIPEYRHNLPIIVMLHLMGALAVVRFAAILAIPWRWALPIAALAVIIPLQLLRCLNYLNQFADDSRLRVRSFVADNLPAGSLVLADRQVGLQRNDDPRIPESERRLPVLLRVTFWVADFGDLNFIRGSGADYVAVNETAYNRLFDPDIHPIPSEVGRCNARRRFYEQLFAEGELIWSSTPHPPTYSSVNPALRLYRLRDSPNATTEGKVRQKLPDPEQPQDEP